MKFTGPQKAMAALLLPLIAEGFFDGPELADLAQLGLASVHAAVCDQTGTFACCPRCHEHTGPQKVSRCRREIRPPSAGGERNPEPPRCPLAFSIRFSTGAKAYAVFDSLRPDKDQHTLLSPSSTETRRAWAMARLYADPRPLCPAEQTALPAPRAEEDTHTVPDPESESRQEVFGAEENSDEARERALRLLWFDLAAKGPGSSPSLSQCWNPYRSWHYIDFVRYMLFPHRAGRLVEHHGVETNSRDESDFQMTLIGLVAAGLPGAARKLARARANLYARPSLAKKYHGHILLGALIGRNKDLATEIAERMLKEDMLCRFIGKFLKCYDARYSFYAWAAQALLNHMCCVLSSRDDVRGSDFPRRYAELICEQPGPCHVLRELERMGYALQNDPPAAWALPFPICLPSEVRALAETSAAVGKFWARNAFVGSPAPVLAEVRRLVKERKLKLQDGSGYNPEGAIQCFSEILGGARDGPAFHEAIALLKAHQCTWGHPAVGWNGRDGRPSAGGLFLRLSCRLRSWLRYGEPRAILSASSCSVCDFRLMRATELDAYERRGPTHAIPLRGPALVHWAYEMYSATPELAKVSLYDPEGVVIALCDELGAEGAARACGLEAAQFEALLSACARRVRSP